MSSSIACIEAGPVDFKIVGHIWPFTIGPMGVYSFQAQAALEVNLEGESEGIELLLNMHEKPSDPDDTTMEWHNHTITL